MLNKRFKYDGKPELKLNTVQESAKKEIEDKINEGIYSFEQVNCALCGSTEAEILAEKDRYGLKCTTNICTNCGFVYTSPRMTQDSYSKFYDSEYRRLYVGTKNAKGFFFEDQMFRGQRIYNYINSKIDLSEKKFKVLEIGCGAGGILEVFRSKGHEVLGFDLGNEYLNYGKEKYNLNLKKGEIINLDADLKPDLIIYSHVFEHILDINNEISLIKEKLAEKGVVYVEVPGLNYIHSTYDMNFLKFLQNAHTYHFTKKSLTTIFENNGFVRVSADDQIRSLFTVSDEDIPQQEFISEYSDVLRYLKKIEKFRYFKFLRFKNLKWKIKKYLIKIAR